MIFQWEVRRVSMRIQLILESDDRGDPALTKCFGGFDSRSVLSSPRVDVQQKLIPQFRSPVILTPSPFSSYRYNHPRLNISTECLRIDTGDKA